MALKEISEQEILNVIASFHHPVSLRDVTKKVGAKVNQVQIKGSIRTLAANGSLIEIRRSPEEAVLFSVSDDFQKAHAGLQSKPKPTKSEKPAAPVVQPKPEIVDQPLKNEALQAQTSVDDKPENREHSILASLFDRPLAKKEITELFGDVESVLNKMIKDNLVESEYIINDMTYQLTNAGYDTLEALNLERIEQPHVEIKTATAQFETESVATEAELAEPVKDASVTTEKPAPLELSPEPVKKARGRPRTKGLTEKPVEKENIKAKKVEITSPAPEQPVPSATAMDPTLTMISQLVDKMVNQRISEIQDQANSNRQEIADNLKKATDSLQTAIDSLSLIQKLI